MFGSYYFSTYSLHFIMHLAPV